MAKPKAEQVVQETPGVTPRQDEEVVTGTVVPRSSGAVMNLSDVHTLMVEDADEDLGFEKGDVAIPFLRVLQSNSPQVKRQNAKYVQDAIAGMFFNTATNRIWDGDTGIYLVPVAFQRQATLWFPRGDGMEGGFVAEIPIVVADEILKKTHKNEKGKDITPPFTADHILSMVGAGGRVPQGFEKGPRECELVYSAMYYVLIVDPAEPGTFEPVAFPLTSTQLKKSRLWNALIKNARLPNPEGPGAYRPAMHAYVYKLTTVPESNTKGDWMGVRIIQHLPLIKYVDGQPTEPFPGGAQVYLAAREFKTLVVSGKVKTAEPDADTMASEEHADEDEKVPF